MSDEQKQTDQQIGKKLATQSPWVLIAFLIHVVGVAVASIMYYAHESSTDDAAPTEISVANAPPPPEQIKPPDIVDREEVPKLKDQDITPSDLTEFKEDADEEPEQGDPTDPNANSELTNLPSGDTTGGSAIGVNGPGHFGIAPSAQGGRRPGGGKYGSRFGGKGKGGAGGRVNEAVTAGLEWLRKHQDEDGHWDCDGFMKHDEVGEPCTGPGNGTNDIGVTGLALLAFLGEGNTMREGTYRKVVRSGIKWLLQQQNENNGLLGTNASQSYIYSHAIATVALCEAYGLSDMLLSLKKPAQQAINYIAYARNPYGVWRYEPRVTDGDTSITGWMVQALLSAKEFQLDVDDAALKTALVFFDSMSDPTTGAAGYTKQGEGSSRAVGKQDKFPNTKTEALTAVVLLCRYLMHQDPKETKIMEPSADTILRKPPVWNENDGSIDMYYWYYGSYAMYQVGGKHWTTWSLKLTDAALKTQKKDGNPKGSWDPIDAWGEDGGRVYSTAIMVLCLEAYYRYGKVSFAR
jgi:hypothetical protein